MRSALLCNATLYYVSMVLKGTKGFVPYDGAEDVCFFCICMMKQCITSI